MYLHMLSTAFYVCLHSKHHMVHNLTITIPQTFNPPFPPPTIVEPPDPIYHNKCRQVGFPGIQFCDRCFVLLRKSQIIKFF